MILGSLFVSTFCDKSANCEDIRVRHKSCCRWKLLVLKSYKQVVLYLVVLMIEHAQIIYVLLGLWLYIEL